MYSSFRFYLLYTLDMQSESELQTVSKLHFNLIFLLLLKYFIRKSETRATFSFRCKFY